MPQTLTEIKAMLAAHGLRPRKRFGQNFLIDHGKMDRILAGAELSQGDVVLEVGPGTGALTERLLDAGARVIAVEIDRDLCAILRDRFADRSRFELIQGDVMASKHALNPAVVAAIAEKGNRRDAEAQGEGKNELEEKIAQFKLIANLPYNIASPLLAILAADYPTMSAAIVMIQREVADRITAAPGGKAYGPLGVLIQAMGRVERIMTLPPGCFWPRPKIDSAVIRITRRGTPLTDDPAGLAALLQRLFTKRRKQIGSILGRGTALPPGVEPTMRPEQLTVRQIVALGCEG